MELSLKILNRAKPHWVINNLIFRKFSDCNWLKLQVLSTHYSWSFLVTAAIKQPKSIS